MGALEDRLRSVRASGAKSFVPYVMGGLPGVDGALLRELESVGADAIEVGIPHSDPIMDGGVIQEASRVALERGTNPLDVLATIREAGLGIPVAVMTYVNPVYRRGFDRFCDELRAASVSAAIVPDLPVDEAGEFQAAARAREIDVVLLAAPGASDVRLDAIGRGSHGFVYCVASYGVTGARGELSATARGLVEALRPRTDLPLLLGVGIGTPEQARQACVFADGVVVGSALVACLLRDDPHEAVSLTRAFRVAMESI